MEANKLPRGLIVDLITPLSDRGIDTEGMGTLLERVMPYADALLLAGPEMGEGRGLSGELKVALLEKAVSLVRGRVPLLFWISESSVGETQTLLAGLEDVLDSSRYQGAMFWLDSPLYYHSNRGLYRHYQELTANATHPFILHNDPEVVRLLGRHLKRSNIRTNILKDLCKIEDIKALIFRGPLARANNYQRAVNSRPDFRVYDGDEARFLAHPSSSGILSGGANIAPRIWSVITRSSLGMVRADTKKPDYVQQMWHMGQLLKDLIGTYEKNPVWFIKKALFDMKIIGSPDCTEITTPHREEESRLAEFLSRHAVD
jgi:dihydrodipicolinate synthase/N-acetylneuraminate lyase